ncbi:MAG: DUF4374 domain-containing protein [Prevotella sp.]|uniref:DUF4374 domain-containing protein n=1 Tax=Prevotella sp. TaxID=59823 RepID=UPI002A2A664C|nr:DUF4374 domain-containing protein [Prevotella sp.]MDD7318133.1 DUF4374 domain-containing protein [Prevotellaceae bacterium]MDY4020978.1 DUF4374 domain-containing protein [Prevotella sp.]
MKNFSYSTVLIALTACMTFTSCSDDDNPQVGNTQTIDPKEVSFVVTAGDPATDLTGGAYMKIYRDLSTAKTGENVYGAGDAVKCFDSFTQITYNPTSGVFTGYIYARGASAEGIGEKQAGLRSYKVENGKLVEIGSPVNVSAFGNTGTFGTYSYAAQISQPYAMVVDATGVGNNISVNLPLYAIDEVNPNISNIVDMGNNQVAMVLNYSNRDSAVVAICDYQLNIKKVIYDDRIGTSVGAMRSVRYTQSGTDDKGNIYVFSGSSATDSKVGALRIKKGETEFDKNYKFDIFSKADGYRFRKAFHISGSKFLLEFFLNKTKYGNMAASGKMAVVDMEAQTLTWVTGLPDPSSVSFGWGGGYADAYYLPVAAPTSMSGGSGGSGGSSGGGRNHAGKSATRAAEASVTPTIYKIDANTGVATAFMTFSKGNLLRAITILKK